MNNLRTIKTATQFNERAEQRLTDFLDNCGDDPRELCIIQEGRVISVTDAEHERVYVGAMFADRDAADDSYRRLFEQLEYMQEQADDSDSDFDDDELNDDEYYVEIYFNGVIYDTVKNTIVEKTIDNCLRENGAYFTELADIVYDNTRVDIDYMNDEIGA